MIINYLVKHKILCYQQIVGLMRQNKDELKLETLNYPNTALSI